MDSGDVVAIRLDFIRTPVGQRQMSLGRHRSSSHYLATRIDKHRDVHRRPWAVAYLDMTDHHPVLPPRSSSETSDILDCHGWQRRRYDENPRLEKT